MPFVLTLPKSTQTSAEVDCSPSSESHPKKKQRLDSSLDISANTSQPPISGDISQTLSLFKCCVCLEYINPPILQCRNSHLFCQSCRQKFKSPLLCPTCRETLPQKDIRSYSVEQIAESIRLLFPCKYSLSGCDVNSLLTEKAKHEEQCGYGPYVCPDVNGRCRWSGSREEVAQHLIDEHNYPINESNVEYWLLLLDYKIETKTWPTILTFNDQKFIFIRKFDSDRKYHFKAILMFIGEQKDADKFKYNIEIRNKSNGTRLQWEDKPISIKNDIKSLLAFYGNDGLNLNENTISRLWYKNYFNVFITIDNDVKL